MKILFKPSLNFRSFWFIVVVFCVPVSRVTWSSAALRAQEASSQTGIKFPIGKNFMVFNTLLKPDLWIQLTGSEGQCLNYFLHFKRFKWVNGKFLLFRLTTNCEWKFWEQFQNRSSFSRRLQQSFLVAWLWQLFGNFQHDIT